MLNAIISGILLGIAQPLLIEGLLEKYLPHFDFLGLLGLIGFVPLFLVLQKESLKKVFLYSLLSGFIYYFITLYWFYIALHDYGHISSFLSIVITMLAPIVLGLKQSIFFSLAKYISIKQKKSIFYYLPLALCALELFKNYFIVGGFPWGNVGYALGRNSYLLQWASLIGVYGLCVIAAVSNALIASFVLYKERKIRVACLVFLLIIFSFGFFRIQSFSKSNGQAVRVALLQGNIDQHKKSNSSKYKESIKDTYIRLSNKAKKSGADLIVWPESSLPGARSMHAKKIDLTEILGAFNVVGLVAYKYDDEKKEYFYTNSAMILDKDNKVLGRYDKSHLVPFGEYVPWPFANIVDKVVPGMGAFLRGRGYVPIEITTNKENTIKIGTTICYEGIFPEVTKSYKNNDASLLINMTNDAWYGISSAAYQHLHMYRLRAVETGLSIVRATNTGVSAHIDFLGNIVASTNLYEEKVLISDVNIVKIKTLYAMTGNLLCLVIAVIFFSLYIQSLFLTESGFSFPKNFGAIFGLFILLISLLLIGYFSLEKFYLDESARTKQWLIMLLGSILAIGFIKNSKVMKNILKISSVVIALLCIIFALYESYWFLLGLSLSAVYAFLGLRKINNR